MTTCPDCNRPLVSAEEWDAMPEYEPLKSDRCYESVDPRGDQWCARLATDLRANADAALLARARALPPGLLEAVEANREAFDQIAALLAFGAAKYGCGVGESGGDQDEHDHVEHARTHLAHSALFASEIGRHDGRDEETGRLDLAHAAARLVVALSMTIAITKAPR